MSDRAKSGYWINLTPPQWQQDPNIEQNLFACSACGRTARFWISVPGEKEQIKPKHFLPYDFCPNCGAEMDAEQEAYTDESR